MAPRTRVILSIFSMGTCGVLLSCSQPYYSPQTGTNNAGTTPVVSTANANPTSDPHAAPSVSPGATPTEAPKTHQIVGSFFLEGAVAKDFSTYTSKKLVIFTSSFGCIQCAEEAKVFKDYLESKKITPDNVELMTVLVAGSEEQIKDLKTLDGTPWTVGYQKDADILNRYCTKKVTPCTIVSIPGQPIAFIKNDPATPQELEAITGEWK